MPNNNSPKNKRGNRLPAVTQAVEAEIVKTDDGKDGAIMIKPGQIKLDKGGNIIIGTLNIFTNSAKNRYHKFYHPQKNPNWHWHIIVDSILAILVIALVAFNIYLLFPARMGIEHKVDLQISVQPTEVISGKDATYYINYYNKSKYQLKNARITVKLPETFMLEKTIPDNIFLKQSNTFELGNIEAGGNGQVALQGQIFGSLGSQKNTSANMNFSTRDYNIYISKQATVKYFLKNSAIDLAIDAPSRVSNGQDFSTTIKYKNNSDYDLSQLIIENNLSGIGYNLKTKLPFDNNSQWRIDNIKAHSDGSITLDGNFTAPENVSLTSLDFQSFVLVSDQKLLQNNLNQKIEIVHPQFILQLVPDKNNINPGETAKYTLNYQNKEKFDLTNPQLTAKCDGDFVASNSLAIPTPSTITAGHEGKIDFSIKLKSKLTPTRSEQKMYSISCWAEARYKMNNDPNLELFSAGPKITQKINTDLTLSAFARYYSPEGDQLGFGPLPPIVSQPTKYWIFISVESTYNDASDISITATLPGNVEFTGKTSVTTGDNILYNSDTRQISWKAQKVIAPSTFYPIIGSAFEVKLTPLAREIGQYAPLLQNIQVSGTDNFTNEKISTKVEDVTSNLQFDKINKSNSKVISK